MVLFLGSLITLAGLAIDFFDRQRYHYLSCDVLANRFPSLNGSPIVLWLSAGMTVITIVKRLEANRRPLPADPIERRNVILRRIFLIVIFKITRAGYEGNLIGTIRCKLKGHLWENYRIEWLLFCVRYNQSPCYWRFGRLVTVLLP